MTTHQKTMIRIALATVSQQIISGRGGWNTAHVHAMEAKGWVRLVSKGVWESHWTVTPAGRSEAQS